MADFDLNLCSQDCLDCIRNYKSKHNLRPGGDNRFKIPCTGIPKEYIDKDLYNVLPEEELKTARSLLDPIEWAKELLDWHCLDPDGEVWKRKNPDEYYEWIKKHPNESILGKSRYHRSYQALVARCSSKRKVFRWGRQLGKSEILMIIALFHLFTKPGVMENEGYRIVVMAPYQSQIDLLFNRVDELLRSTATTANAVLSHTKSPPRRLELHNHSMMIGFTAGSKSGGNADNIRGQKANMLVVDEADYLNPGDLESAISVITNQQNANVFMSSTPKGTREKFYNACQSRLYREFHYPSHANPLWNEDLELTFREQLSEVAYKHEVCFVGDTEVLTSVGVKRIKNIDSNDRIICHTLEDADILNKAQYTGDRKVCQLFTSAGKIQCTSNHSFPDRAFKKQSVELLNELPVYLTKRRYKSTDRMIILARLVGYNLGDGSSCSTRYQSSFYSDTKADIVHIVEDLKAIYPKYKGGVVFDRIENSDNPKALVKTDGDRYTANTGKSITLDLIKHGIVRGKKTYQKFDIPDFIKYGNSAIKAAFLASLFGAEGSTPRISDGYMPGTISLSMNKQAGICGDDFFGGLVCLLNDLGIRSIYSKKTDSNGYQIYILYIYNDFDNILRFFEVVGYYYAEEKEKLAFYWVHYLKYYQYKLKEKRDRFIRARKLREAGSSFKTIMAKTGLSFSQVDKATNNNRVPRRFYKKEILKFDRWIQDRIVDDALFVDIFDREYIGVKPVFNITVNTPDHSYLLANGVRTFNCAEFGEQEEGAFQNIYVEAAKSDYRYGAIARELNWTYMLGVDWNDVKIGTNIAVVGFNPLENGFYLLDRHIVSREGWTQLSACQKIAELNRVWRPDFIYIDEGYGSTQLEVLKKFGLDSILDPTKGPNHPDAKLKDIVKSYNFGGNVEIRDLVTGQWVKKPAKPFLVENTVRRFESGTIRFSQYDEILAKQLLNYVIDHVTQTNMPVYRSADEKIGDHALDALMLALVGFTLEKTSFGKVKHSIGFRFSGRIGEKTDPDKRFVRIIVEKKEKERVRDKHMPEMDRAKMFENDEQPLLPTKRLPISHSRADSGIQLWTWPGWEHDAPRPKSTNAGRFARIRPTRKNI